YKRPNNMRKKAPRIFILLLNWNGAKDTIECLQSLKKLDYSNFVPIVVDHGSHESSVEQIRRAHTHVPIYQCGENLGFAAGNNVGIRWALEHRAEWVLLLNNDTTVDPNLLKAYLQAAQERQAKVLGAKILRYHE